MSNKQHKKYRKAIRKETKKLAEAGWKAAALKLARQRDVVFIICVVGWLFAVSSPFWVRWIWN